MRCYSEGCTQTVPDDCTEDCEVSGAEYAVLIRWRTIIFVSAYLKCRLLATDMKQARVVGQVYAVNLMDGQPMMVTL